MFDLVAVYLYEFYYIYCIFASYVFTLPEYNRNQALISKARNDTRYNFKYINFDTPGLRRYICLTFKINIYNGRNPQSAKQVLQHHSVSTDDIKNVQM